MSKILADLCSIKENVKIKNTTVYNVLVVKMFCKNMIMMMNKV